MLKHISKKKDKRLTHKVVNKFPLTRILRISHKSSKTLNPLWQWFHNRAAFSTRSCPIIILITALLISATFYNWIINIMKDYDAAVVDALCHSFTGIFNVLPIYESDPNFLHLQVPGRWSNRKRMKSIPIRRIGQPKVMWFNCTIFFPRTRNFSLIHWKSIDYKWKFSITRAFTPLVGYKDNTKCNSNRRIRPIRRHLYFQFMTHTFMVKIFWNFTSWNNNF